jgi:hypothetical protein
MVELDEYQMDNAKNFKYRYYPPRLVELQDGTVVASGEGGSGAAGKYSSSMRSSSGGYTIWVIIIIVIVLTCFLMLGILYMDSTGTFSRA